MPWNSGVFTRLYNWIQDRDAGIKILASKMDAEMDGFTTGINTCLTKDGQNTPTDNLPMGGNRHTGVGDASARTDYAATGQVQDGEFTHATSSGSSNAYVLSLSPALSAYAQGQNISFKANFANTGGCTLNINGLGAKAIQRPGGAALVTGDIPINAIVDVAYDGAQFKLTNCPGLTASDKELNTLDGITATTAELNYVNGVTSGIQTQLDNLSSTKIASFGITADSGGTETVTGGETIDIAGGNGIDTSRSGQTVTVAAETSSESNEGVIERASNTEFDAGTDDTRAVSTAKIKRLADGNTSWKIQSAAYDTGSVNQSAVGAGAIHQSEIDTSIGEVSQTTSGANLVLPGGEYGFYPQTRFFVSSMGGQAEIISSGGTGAPTSYATYIYLRPDSGDTLYAQQRYINSSAPYDLGDGEVAFFIFAEISPNGDIVSTYCADTPPWIYNGPTDVTGKLFKVSEKSIRRGHGQVVVPVMQYGRMVPSRQVRARQEGTTLRELMIKGELSADELSRDTLEFQAIMPQDKNADMGVIPHPFVNHNGTVVLLDPMSDLQVSFCSLQSAGESITDIVREYLIIDNTNNGRASSPSVMPVNFRWKDTGRR